MPEMEGSDVLIVLYGDRSLLRIHNYNTEAEDVCIKAAQTCGIGPLTRHLFGLYHSESNTWLSPCDPLKVNNKSHYDFRLRFKLPNVGKLAKIDRAAFDYYFQQVRQDFLSGNIPEIAKVKEQALGLAVTDMLRVKLEKGLSSQMIESEYKNYLPQEVKRQYKYFLLSHFLRKAMGDALSKLQENRQDLEFVKEQYIQTVLELQPSYGCEDYQAIMDEDGQAISVRLQMDPYHSKQPGLRKQVGSKKAPWVHLCSIEELCYISMGKDITVEISRRNGVPQYFRFQQKSQMRSFVGLLDGYYRLSEKWTFNLCKELSLPSLIKLKTIKCHGPVGQEFAYKKLQSKSQGQHGAFLLREHSDYYSYWLDVIMNGQETPVSYQIIQIRSEKFGEFQIVDRPQTFASLQKLLDFYAKEKLINTCIPPSEYDKSPLLLCKSENTDYVSVSKDSSLDPVCINTRNIVPVIGHEYVGKFTMVKKALWLRQPGDRVKCCVKGLRSQSKLAHLHDFMQMANNCVFWHNEAIVTMYGFLLSPPMLVMEYLPIGPLDKYLQNHWSDLQEVDLVEGATYLAKALWYLEEQNLCHGNIRCFNVLVSAHESNSFKVKLSDSSLSSFDISQIHWIPPECYGNLQMARNSLPADVWAFGTTLWEIFSYGVLPLQGSNPQEAKMLYQSGERLPKPKACDPDVYKLMNECWTNDPDSRKKPQAIMRDINQTLYEVYNSRRTHEYATVVPRQMEADSVSTSTLSSNATENETLPDTPLIFDRRFQNANSCLDQLELDLCSSRSNHNRSFSDSEADDTCRLNPINEDEFLSPCIPPSPSDNSLLSMLDDQEWLIEMSQLEIGPKLGQGFYGEVRKAWLTRWSGLEREEVAIKQLRKSGLGSGLQDLLREISIMKTLHHKNIVEIKGVVEDPEMLLVMEFMPGSSLLVYLRTYKNHLTEKQLLKFATDVAEGMEYLGQKRIVHRDLAARNILVASDDLVKISDFGLAQMMGPKDYYRLRTNRDLPIRWYAPETLRHWRFTHKSDVWSFGITLWEMFSFGEEPVMEGCKDDELLNALESGKRLSCPNTISMPIYSYLMKSCWEAEPDARPTFTKLVTELQTFQA